MNGEKARLSASCITSGDKPCILKTDIASLESNNKDTMQSTLFYMLGSIDSIITEAIKYIEKGLPFYLKLGFEVKNASKTMTLNISNDALDADDIIILGGLQISMGIGIELAIGALVGAGIISGGWALLCSISAAMLISYFLTDIYLYLKDKALSLWQDAKDIANSAWQSIMSLIESDERSLEERKEDMANKVADEILKLQEVPDEAFVKDISKEAYSDLINFLCQQRASAGDIHQYLECSQCIVYALDSKNTESKAQNTPLRTAPNTIPIHLQAKCLNHNNEPLANKEIYAFSMDIGHFVDRAISDDKGIIEFKNILVYDNGSLSQVYFVLKQLGLDEEQKITHIQISPRLDISPMYKKQGSLEGIKTLHFAKNIPKHIEQHDKINAQVRVSAIRKIDTIQAHNATPLAIPLSLKAEYTIKDKTKDTKEAQSLIAQYRHNTKWGYMVFEKHQDIHKGLQKQGIILSPTSLNMQGEYISIPLRKDWEDRNIAIFAYLKTPSKSVRYDIKHYKAMPVSLCYNGNSLDILSYGQILKSYKLSQTKNEYLKEHGHIELEQGVDTNIASLDTGVYKIEKSDIQSALIPTSNKHRISAPHLAKEFLPLAFESMDKKGQRFYISYNANQNNLNLIEYEDLQRPINLKSPQIKEHIKIFLESREFFEDLHTIHATMQDKGLDTLVLEVGYETGEMVLEVVRKWEYRGGGNSNAHNWATISEFSLKLDGGIIKDSQGQDIKGYIVEPARYNPNSNGYNLPPEQQQKISGSDTRIPAGEYKVFWKYSTKQVYARSAIDLEFINLLKLNGICLKNDVRDFSINPHSINKGDNQKYDNNRKKLLHNKTDNFKKQHDWDIHSHIMPELKAINGTNMGSRSYILIHNGDNGIWSEGCLLPGELENELEPKGHKNNNGLYQETLLKTMQVIKLLIEHDVEAYQNYAKGEAQSTIRNFIVKIKEENIKIYPKNKMTKWEK